MAEISVARPNAVQLYRLYLFLLFKGTTYSIFEKNLLLNVSF